MKRLALLSVALSLGLLVACGGEEPRGRGATTLEKAPATALTATEAIQHVGSRKTVCGDVESPTYASSSRGS